MRPTAVRGYTSTKCGNRRKVMAAQWTDNYICQQFYTQQLTVKPNTHRRRDSTVGSSRVGGVYGIRNYSWRQSRRVWTNLPTAKSSCVMSAVWTHPSAIVTQFTTSCVVELLRLVTSDVIMTSLLKKLSVSMKIHVVKRLWSLFGHFQIVDRIRIRRQSSWVSCEFCIHIVDATQLDSWVASASAMCMGHKAADASKRSSNRCGTDMPICKKILTSM